MMKRGQSRSNLIVDPFSIGEQCCRDRNIPEECYPLCEKNDGLSSRQGINMCSAVWDIIVSCRSIVTTPKPGAY